ncbi:hypothetical protein ACI797_24885 [Geodermatophilus sp. SYSU D00691]
MSFIFGGVRGRSDPELEAANRRHRLRMARDINDERTLADPDGGSGAPRRGRHWLVLAVAAAVMAVLALIARGQDDVPLTADCSTPAIAVASSRVDAGAALRFRLTGPNDTPYVVTLDGEPVRGDAGSVVGYRETPAGPALQLQLCLSPTLTIAAPAGDGPHELALLEVAGDGTTREVTAVTVTVTGTR